MTPPLLFVSGEYPPDVGGVGDYTDRLRAGLKSVGWQSGVLSRQQVARWDARALVQLVRMAPQRGIVHIQYQAGAFDLHPAINAAPWLLRERAKVPVIVTLHDLRPPYLFPNAGRLRLKREGASPFDGRLLAQYVATLLSREQCPAGGWGRCRTLRTYCFD